MMSSAKTAWGSGPAAGAPSLDIPAMGSASPSSTPSPSSSRSRDKSPAKSSARSPPRSPARSSAKYPVKSTEKATTRSPSRSPSRSPARVTPKSLKAVNPMTLPPPLALPMTGEASRHLSPIVNTNQETRAHSNSWLANIFHKKTEDVPPLKPVTTVPIDQSSETFRSMLRQEYQAENDDIPFNEMLTRTQNDIIIYDYASQIDEVVRHGEQYYGGPEQLQPSYVDHPQADRYTDDTQHIQQHDDSHSHAHKESYDQQAKYPVKQRKVSFQTSKYVAVDLSSTSPKSTAWVQTDISQAPPLTLRPRGAPMDTKNRRVVRVVFPASYNPSTSTTPSTSQPSSNIQSPAVSNISSPMSSAPVSPRKRGSDHRRASLASVDGEMNEHYDEVFDDVFASDEDEYDELDGCDNVDMDITDDPEVEWENENFIENEAKAHQVLQLKKLQQERELQQERRQEQYRTATIWLDSE